MDTRIKIAHLINPVNVDTNSDLFVAQPITFQSLIKSKNNSIHPININQYAIGFKEDVKNLPEEFVVLPELVRSVQEVNSFSTDRKLPLIKDLLNPLRELEDIDYIIYTNVDIGLMPYFYDFLLQKFYSGSDSLIINRRTIEYSDSLEKLYSQVGNIHPGKDCFVFRKSLLDDFELGNICIGSRFIGLIFYLNLLVFSNEVEILTDKHLTFHIGDDRVWDHTKFSEYSIHNSNEALIILEKLCNETNDSYKIKELNKGIKRINKFLNRGNIVNRVIKKIFT